LLGRGKAHPERVVQDADKLLGRTVGGVIGVAGVVKGIVERIADDRDDRQR
jgi:hypothetical protein